MGNNLYNRRKFIRDVGVTGLIASGIGIAPSLADASPVAKAELKKGMVFLFQGDSITDGNRGRTPDPNHIMGHGYAFSIASRVGADLFEKAPVFHNRGISGNKVTDLAARWDRDTLELKPDVLSILIGVNDVGDFMRTGSREPLELFEPTYRKILSQARSMNPDLLLVLCQPFVLPVGRVKEKRQAWEAAIGECQAIAAKLAREYQAVFVHFQDVMNNACKKAAPDYWMWDGIHPTVAGHELLAREWIARVGMRLNLSS